jgi:EAL domain-containing protein (putative c-di-GMP-specific phosphodiesterase class I)
MNSFNAKNLDSTALPEMIRVLRKHLGMDIAFLSQVNGELNKINLVDTDELHCALKAGFSSSLEETYCQLIVEKKIPNIIHDVEDIPLVKDLPITKILDIKSYISTPVLLSDGTLYGTLCCYSHTTEPSLNKRDFSMMEACAEMATIHLERQHRRNTIAIETEERVHTALLPNAITIKYQPIYDLVNEEVCGFEALSRFNKYPNMRPDLMFKDAKNVGLGAELEVAAIREAFEGLQHFSPDIYISLNISPDTILHQAFVGLFDNIPLDRITLEITEHTVVELYHHVKAVLEPLRKKGMKLAIDDAGAGFSSFRHILELNPDIIKLDWTLTKNIDSDPGRRALVAAFVRFSKDTNSVLISEGVETKSELLAMQELGIERVQGNYFGYPMTLKEAGALV